MDRTEREWHSSPVNTDQPRQPIDPPTEARRFARVAHLRRNRYAAGRSWFRRSRGHPAVPLTAAMSSVHYQLSGVRCLRWRASGYNEVHRSTSPPRDCGDRLLAPARGGSASSPRSASKRGRRVSPCPAAAASRAADRRLGSRKAIIPAGRLRFSRARRAAIRDALYLLPGRTRRPHSSPGSAIVDAGLIEGAVSWMRTRPATPFRGAASETDRPHFYENHRQVSSLLVCYRTDTTARSSRS